jgi:hypothetical protein
MILGPWKKVKMNPDGHKCFTKPHPYPLGYLYKRYTAATWKRGGETAVVLTPISTHLLDGKMLIDTGLDGMAGTMKWEYKILPTTRVQFGQIYSEEVYGVIPGNLELAMFLADVKASSVGYSIEDIFSLGNQL